MLSSWFSSERNKKRVTAAKMAFTRFVDFADISAKGSLL